MSGLTRNKVSTGHYFIFTFHFVLFELENPVFDKIPFLNISRKRPICPIKINDFGILNEKLTVFKIELTIDRCKSAFVLSDNC